MIAVAILLPWLALFLRGRILQGIICLVLQCLVIGWIPAAVWAVLVVNADRQERRHKELIRAGRGSAQIGVCRPMEVSVNTNPPGADLQFSNGQSCKSPCSLKVSRSQSLQINIAKEGCQTQTATMIPTLAGGGVILGGLIDYGTGAVYDLQPNPLTVTMACQKTDKLTSLMPEKSQ